MGKGNSLSNHDEILATSNRVTKMGVFQYDIQQNHIDWNETLKEIHEESYDYIPTTENFYGNIESANSKNQILQAHQEALRNGTPFEIDYKIVTAKGNTRHVRTSVQPIQKAIEITGIYGVTMDITESEAQQADTLQKLKQLNYAEKLAKSGSWEWDIATDTLTWSENFYVIFNHDRECPVSYNTYLSYVHPDDKEKIIAKFEQALKTNYFPESSYRIQLKDGTIKTLNSIGKVITDNIGEVIKMVGTCQDITEKTERERELLQKKRQLKLTENNNKSGSWQLDLIKDEFKWTDNLYRIFDFKVGDKINFKTLQDYIHPEDKELVQERFAEIINNRKSHTFKHRIVLKDNTVRTVKVISDAITDSNGTVVELIGTTQDITRKIDIEQKLIEKNQLLNFAEHLTQMGYWRYKPELNEVFWSDNLYKIFDHPKTNKLTFESYFNKIHPEDKDFVKEKIDQSISEQNFYDFTHRIIVSANEIKVIQIIGKVTRNLNDGQLELLGTCLDISRNETQELELSQKNQRLSIAEKMAMIGHWQWDTAKNTVYWSENLHAIYGHDKNKPLTFETYINYVHEEDRETVVTNLTNAMQNGDFPESTYRIQLDDGTVKIIKSSGKIILNKKGEVLEMSGICQDITIARNKELELLEINRQLNLAEQIAMLGMWVWKPSKNIFKWSESLYKLYGFEPGSEVNIDTVIAMIYPPDKGRVQKIIDDLLKGIHQPRSIYRILLDNNEIKTLEVRREIYKDEHGNIELFGTTQDITHIVETEQLLKEKNHLLSFTEEMASMGSWQWNPYTGVSKWSDNLYKIYDLELGLPIDMDLFLSRIHPEDSKIVTDHIANVVTTKKNDSLLLYRIILNDGTIRSLELMAEVVKDNNGKIIELIGTAQDVTDRIKREQDLLEKNQLLNFAEQLSSIGYWKWDIVNDVMEKSENLLKILDFDQETKLNFNTYINRVHPVDRKKVIDVSRKIIETKKFDKFHHRIIKNDNSIRSIKLIGEVILDSEGNVIELIGSSQDITEQIEVQKKILDTNRNLEKSTITLTSKNKQLAEFNHITSHNLRSPVSNLNALLAIYKSANNETKKGEIFGKFEIVIGHLTETLNALIETIAIKHNAVETTQKLCFEQTLLKTKEILAAELIESNANIRCDFSKAKNVKYNPIYLESIFLNLVSNSLKYKSENRVPEILITSNIVNGKTTLEFKDNGLGIDMKSNGHKLFGLNKVFHKHPDAKGVGLFLTKAQIAAMGGSISAKSKVDVGTSFFIILN